MYQNATKLKLHIAKTTYNSYEEIKTKVCNFICIKDLRKNLLLALAIILLSFLKLFYLIFSYRVCSFFL